MTGLGVVKTRKTKPFASRVGFCLVGSGVRHTELKRADTEIRPYGNRTFIGSQGRMSLSARRQPLPMVRDRLIAAAVLRRWPTGHAVFASLRPSAEARIVGATTWGRPYG